LTFLRSPLLFPSTQRHSLAPQFKMKTQNGNKCQVQECFVKRQNTKKAKLLKVSFPLLFHLWAAFSLCYQGQHHWGHTDHHPGHRHCLYFRCRSNYSETCLLVGIGREDWISLSLQFVKGAGKGRWEFFILSSLKNFKCVRILVWFWLNGTRVFPLSIFLLEVRLWNKLKGQRKYIV
jgi:hypothetical protein